jgi:ankyrin repeat protein
MARPNRGPDRRKQLTTARPKRGPDELQRLRTFREVAERLPVEEAVRLEETAARLWRKVQKTLREGGGARLRELLRGQPPFVTGDVLSSAVGRGDLRAVRGLIAAGANTTWRDETDRGLLVVAAEGGNVGVVRELWKADRASREDARAALTAAAANGHADVVRLLLEAVGPRGPGDVTAALRAAADGSHEEVFELLAPLADPEAIAIASGDLTASRAAAAKLEKPVLRAARRGDAARLRELLKDRPPAVTGAWLAAAVHAGDLPAVRALIAAGADTGWRDEEAGETLLMTAAAAGHTDVARELLVRGVEVRETDGEGLTALDHAAEGGHLVAVRLLLGAGGERAAKRADLALQLAAARGHAGVVRELLRQGVKAHPAQRVEEAALARAAGDGHADVVRLLLEAGGAPASRLAAIALDAAAAEGHEVVFDLLAPLVTPRDADPARKTLDAVLRGRQRRARSERPAPSESTSRLIRAARAGDLEAVRRCLAAGADVNGVDKKGYSALRHAMQEEKTAAVRLLLAAGADPNAHQGEGGTTPLMAAARRGGGLGLLFIRMLCEAGADADGRDDGGQTALDYAEQSGLAVPAISYAEVLSELVRRGADCGRRSLEARVRGLRRRVTEDERSRRELAACGGDEPARIKLERERRTEWMKWEHETVGRRHIEQLQERGMKPAGTYATLGAIGMQLRALVDAKRSVYAVVYEGGYFVDEVWFDLMTCYADGTTLTYTSEDRRKLIQRPGHVRERVTGLDAAAAYDRLLRERPRRPLGPVSAGQFAADFEKLFASGMSWRMGPEG